jgi:hypothetical protein
MLESQEYGDYKDEYKDKDDCVDAHAMTVYYMLSTVLCLRMIDKEDGETDFHVDVSKTRPRK